MPTYGYHCDHCGAEFDLWQRMTDDAVADCPKCGKAARRIFYPVGVVFKGSGFYKTDSRSSSSSTTTSDPKPASSGDTEKSSTDKPAPEAKPSTGESSPAPSTESKPKSPPAK